MGYWVRAMAMLLAVALTDLAWAADYSLVYSLTADRAGSLPLASATVAGDIYGRLSPETADIDEVRFYLDSAGSPFKTERAAPYDLQGGPDSGANPYATTALSEGPHLIRTEVDLNDGSSLGFDTLFTVQNRVNVAPALVPIGAQSMLEGGRLDLTVSASDANGDPISFSASGLPAFASFIDLGNGSAILSASPANADIGDHSITISADDGELSSSETFTLRVLEDVNLAPELAPIGPQGLIVGDSLTLTLSASDLNNDSLIFSAPGLPAFASLVDHGDNSASLTFTPGDADLGSHAIGVQVSDAEFSDGETFDLRVEPQPSSPYSLVYSLSADRAGSLALDGATVAGNIYGRIEPTSGGIQQVRFYLDGASTPFKSESAAPYDLRGGPVAAANPYDTTELPDGEHVIRSVVRLNDGSEYDFDSRFIVRNSPNSAPTLTPIADQTLQPDSVTSLPISASDSNGDPLTVSASGLPVFALFSDNGDGSANLILSPEAIDADSAAVVTISVSDGQDSIAQTFSVTVLPLPNRAPVLNAIGAQAVTAGESLTLVISASDADVDPLTMTATGVPAFGTFTDNGDGTASLVLTPDVGDAGATPSITVTVSDGAESVTETFVVTVGEPPNSAPVLNAIGVQKVTAGESLTVSISASDADADPLAITATGVPHFGVFTDNGDGTANLVLNPAVGDIGAIASITVTVSDGEDSVSETFTVTVSDLLNIAPVLDAIGAQSVTAGDSLTVSISASDADADPLTITATGVPAFGVFTDNGNGTASLVLNPAVGDAGVTPSIMVTVSDSEDSASETFTVTVGDPPNNVPALTAIGAQSVTAGESLTVSISASDADADSLTITATGVPAFGVFTDNGDGTANLVLNPAVGDAGATPSITVTVSDGEDSTTETFTVTVSAALGNSPPLIAPIADIALTVNQPLTVALSASDAEGDAVTLSATGLPTFASFTDLGDGAGELVLTPTAADAGSLSTLQFIASDGQGQSSASVSLQIHASAAPAYNLVYSLLRNRSGFLLLSGAEVAGNLNARVEPDSGIVQARFYLDGSATPFRIENVAPYELNGGGSLADPWDTTAISDGPHVIRTELDLSDGALVVLDSPFSVANNQAPVLAPIGNQSVIAGDLLNLSLNAADETPETLVFSATGLPAFASLSDNGSGSATLSLLPQVADIGSYSVTVSISDGARSSSETFTIEVLAESNYAPVLATISPLNVPADAATEVTLSASDLNADPLSFSSLDLPAFASLLDKGDGTATLTVAPSAAEIGVHSFTVTVSDGLLEHSELVTLTVGVNPQSIYDLVYSLTRDRAGSLSLDGATIAGDLYARIEPETEVQQTRFYLDGASEPFRTENVAPFELNGGDTLADPWDTTPLADGAHSIRTIVVLGDGREVELISNFIVANNAPPVLASIGPRSVIAGSALNFDVSASDEDPAALSFSASGLPAFAALVDHGDGTASFSANPAAAEFGDFAVTIAVSDGVLSASETFTLSVLADINHAPQLVPIGNLSQHSGTLLDLAISASDVNGDAIAISATGLPGFATLVDHGDGTATLTAQPTQADIGLHSFSIAASDGALSSSESVELAVTLNPQQRYDLVYSLTANRAGSLSLAGATIAGNLYARIEPETDVVEVNFYLDGAATPFRSESVAPYELNGGDSSVAFPWDTTVLNDGAHSISSVISLNDGSTVTLNSPFTLANNHTPRLDPLADQAVQAGASLNLTVTAVDDENDPLTYTVSAPNFVTATDNGDGTLSLVASPAIDEVGSYLVVVTVSDGSSSDSLAFGLSVFPAPLAGELEISELMAANGGSLLDGDGDASDWIELHSTAAGPLDLAGWCLTTDLANPSQWCFSGGSIQPGEYLVAFASGKPGSALPDEVHASFTLDELGDYLALTRPDGQTVQVFAPTFPPQRSDIAYGFNIAGDPRYFPAPTPGAVNDDGLLDLLAFDVAEVALQAQDSGGRASAEVVLSALAGNGGGYSISVDDGGLNWLSVMALAGEDGQLPDRLRVAADACAMSDGSYSGTVSISAPDMLGVSLPVTLTVSSGGVSGVEELPTAGGGAELHRYPYLQQESGDSLTIMWGTLSDGLGCVQLRPVSAGFGTRASSEVSLYASADTGIGHDFYQHEAVLTGLLPDTEYVYDVIHDGMPLARNVSFKTPPAAGAASVSFAVVGDTGTEYESPRRVRNALASTLPNGEQVYPHHFVIGVGDLAYNSGTYAEFDSNFFDQLSGKGIQPWEHDPASGILAHRLFFATLGNHEYGNNVQNLPQGYLDSFSYPIEPDAPLLDAERYYSFDAGPAHFVVVDAMKFVGDTAANRMQEMLDWLAADLAASTATWKLVFLHHSFFSFGPHGTWGDITENRNIRWHLLPVLQQHGVQALFFGHDHMYQRTQPIKVVTEAGPEFGKLVRLADGSLDNSDGIVYIGSGNGGADLHNRATQPSVQGSDLWLTQRDEWGIGYDFLAQRNGEPVLFDYAPDGDTDVPLAPQQRKGFVHVTVTDTALQGTAYNIDGDVLDQFTITP